jgi:large subunit ribosomal protein L10
MRLEDKERVTQELFEQLKESGTIYLTDFTGLNVKAMTEFRSRLRMEGIGYRVVKNTLMKRALEDLDLPDLSEHLDGPTGLVLSKSDPVVPAKVVNEFAKEHDDRPVIKIGIIDREEVSPDHVKQLADIPPYEVLLGSIAGSLTAGVSGVVGVLNAIVRDIADMIGQVAHKTEEAEAVEEVAEEAAEENELT